MNDSRETIFRRLRAVKPELGLIKGEMVDLPVSPIEDTSSERLLALFQEQAEALSAVVHPCASEEEAVRTILDLIGDNKRVLSWAFEHIPLKGLAGAMAARGIQATQERDGSLQVGLTGADAALAATGSLVLLTGAGKPRLASLLPPVHVAMMRADQIVTDLETWVALTREAGLDAFQATASAMVISGPSRTADIAMQLILGMHGPSELHIVILL